MKRRLDCVCCGRALPAGCRIDKKYCDQRCVELAYYEKHPEKRAKKLAKLRESRTTTGLRARRPESAPDLVERMEAAHASTRQELGAVRERLAQMEALLRGQSRSSKEQGPAQNAVPDSASVRKLGELQSTLQTEKNRAEEAERRQATLEQEIAELNRQIREWHRGGNTRELALSQEAARKAEQRIRELEAALKQAQTGVTRPVSVVQDPTQAATLQAARKSVSDLEAKLQGMTQRATQAERAQETAEIQVTELRKAVASWRTHSETQTRQLTEAQNATRAAEQRAAKAQKQTHEQPSARLPWTHPASDNAHHYISRWEEWGDATLTNLDELTETALAEIPSQLWKNGDRKLSQEMRDWLSVPSRVLTLLSRQIVLRIVCTPPPERRSEKQKEVLGEAALADSLQFLRRRQPDLTDELDQTVATDRENYEILAGKLVLACAEIRLKSGY